MSIRHEQEEAQREDPSDLELIWAQRDREDEHAPIESIVGTTQELLAALVRKQRECEQLHARVDDLTRMLHRGWDRTQAPF